MLGKFHLDGIPPAPRGTPQLQVTFEIDANGILNVSASDTSTGRRNQITITNEKGRLSQAKIDRMIQAAEQFNSEEKAHKLRIEAKNGLENYCYSLRNSMQEGELKEKFTAEDKEALEKGIKDTLDWLDKNQLGEKDEFEAKQKDLEAIANPILVIIHKRIECRNSLENYCNSVRKSMLEDSLNMNMLTEVRESADRHIRETLKWLEEKQMARQEELERKQKELESVISPLMMNDHSTAEAGPTIISRTAGLRTSGEAPRIEEAD